MAGRLDWTLNQDRNCATGNGRGSRSSFARTHVHISNPSVQVEMMSADNPVIQLRTCTWHCVEAIATSGVMGSPPKAYHPKRYEWLRFLRAARSCGVEPTHSFVSQEPASAANTNAAHGHFRTPRRHSNRRRCRWMDAREGPDGQRSSSTVGVSLKMKHASDPRERRRRSACGSRTACEVHHQHRCWGRTNRSLSRLSRNRVARLAFRGVFWDPRHRRLWRWGFEIAAAESKATGGGVSSSCACFWRLRCRFFAPMELHERLPSFCSMFCTIILEKVFLNTVFPFEAQKAHSQILNCHVALTFSTRNSHNTPSIRLAVHPREPDERGEHEHVGREQPAELRRIDLDIQQQSYTFRISTSQ